MTAAVEEWLELESDPGLFTMLLENIGVKGVQVEDIYDMTEDITEEIFGFVFLFKWQEDQKKSANKRSSVQSNLDESKNCSYETNPDKLKEIYFAHQVIPNSCATNALLSVLMNCHEKIQIGKVLTKFRDLTLYMTPDKRGAALGNMPELADAHNKRARYLKSNENSFGSSNANASYSSGLVTRNSSTSALNSDGSAVLEITENPNQNETYHFVSYVPIGDSLYELDGLQPYPIWHGKLPVNTKWTRVCLELIRARMTQHPHYSLMALVRDRRHVLAEQLTVLNKNRQILRQALQKLDTNGPGSPLLSNYGADDNLDYDEQDEVFSIKSANTAATNNDDTESSCVEDKVSTSNNNNTTTNENSNAPVTRRASQRKNGTRKSMRNQQNIKSASSSQPDDYVAVSNSVNIIKQEDAATTTAVQPLLDVMQPITIDVTNTNSTTDTTGSQTAQPMATTATSSSNSSSTNRSSKYPSRRKPNKTTTTATTPVLSSSSVVGSPAPPTITGGSGGRSPRHFSSDQLKHLLQVVDSSIKSCRSRMTDEIEKYNKYLTDDVRRSFNYDDFIRGFLFALNKQGLLDKLLAQQRINRGSCCATSGDTETTSVGGATNANSADLVNKSLYHGSSTLHRKRKRPSTTLSTPVKAAHNKNPSNVEPTDSNVTDNAPINNNSSRRQKFLNKSTSRKDRNSVVDTNCSSSSQQQLRRRSKRKFSSTSTSNSNNNNNNNNNDPLQQISVQL